MAQYKNDIADVELECGTIHRSFAHASIGQGDGGGLRYGIRLKRNGAPVNLDGASCIGYFIRPDKITLVINGTTSNGAAYVELPQAACAVEGTFSLVIKVAGTGFAETMRIVDGTVVQTTTGSIADPSSEVPTLEELTAIIAEAEEAAETIDGLSVSATQIMGTRYKIAVTKE